MNLKYQEIIGFVQKASFLKAFPLSSILSGLRYLVSQLTDNNGYKTHITLFSVLSTPEIIEGYVVVFTGDLTK